MHSKFSAKHTKIVDLKPMICAEFFRPRVTISAAIAREHIGHVYYYYKRLRLWRAL